MSEFDTITALATPPGTGALAIIRISGPEAFNETTSFLKEKELFNNAKANTIHLYTFLEKEKSDIIDEITAIKYRAPRSFTGEDMVEIICHGGAVTVERILASLVSGSIRYAQKGEFTKRAFCNGKTSITKAEAINQLISSKTRAQQKCAIQNYIGGYEQKIILWKELVENILIELESAIEFNHEDDLANRDSRKKVIEKIANLTDKIDEELEKRNKIEDIEKGLDIAIVGPRNAGKSTLFNLLLGYNRSIVDSNKGTTRDFVSEMKRVVGVPIRFIDTAGIANVENGVEQQGIEKSVALLKNSAVSVWITAADEDFKSQEKVLIEEGGNKVVGILNKIDLSENKEKEQFFKDKGLSFLRTSAQKSNERDRVEKFILRQAQENINSVSYDCVIGSTRQRKIFEQIKNELQAIGQEQDLKEEIIAFHCREILNKLQEFIGKQTTEGVLNKIFDEFCVGK